MFIRNLTCTIAAFCFLAGSAPAKTLQLYLLTGQSNSLGTVKGAPASPALLEQYKSKGATRFWHHNFNKASGESIDVTPPASTSWGAIVPQICSVGGKGKSTFNCMGPEYGFAYMMEKKGWRLTKSASASDTDTGIIKASLDGGGKEFWYKGKPSYNTIISTVKAACANALKNGYDKVEIVGLIYLQGESNRTDTKVAEDFTDLLSNLERDIVAPGVDVSGLKNKQAIMGEQAKWNTTNFIDPVTKDVSAGDNGGEGSAGMTRDVQRSFAKGKKNMGWVPTRDLAKINPGDGMGVHYDGKSQITIGARYAYEAGRLAGYDVGTVRSGDRDAVLSSPEAWMNGKLPLKTPAIWDVASSAKDNMVGKTAALYGIVIQDPYLNMVTIRGIAPASGASAKDSVLMLGKGGISIAKGKSLTIASLLSIRGNQAWNIAAGSSLLITGSTSADASSPACMSGAGVVSIINADAASDQASAAKVIFNLSPVSGVKNFTGNLSIGKGVETSFSGTAPCLNLVSLNITLSNRNLATGVAPIKITGKPLLIGKGIMLTIDKDIKPAAQVAFKLADLAQGSLPGLTREKISVSPQSADWSVSAYDVATGVVTLKANVQP